VAEARHGAGLRVRQGDDAGHLTADGSAATAGAGRDWHTCMRAGHFADAWALSDQALRRPLPPGYYVATPRHLQRIWDGSPVAGRRVLVRCYHGLGDTIQFIRYAAALKAVAREVIVWAQPGLIPLLATVPGIDALLPLHDGTPDVTYDVDVEVMELPHLFRTTLDTIPADVPYLHATPLEGAASGRPAVALHTIAGDWNPGRSIPEALLPPLLDSDLVHWHHIHPHALGWMNSRRSPIAENARGLRAMDLVVTVDTMTAHLAGALGVRTWLLLPHDADWRWLSGRTDSPWYPTMRIFHATPRGGWAGVIADVADGLDRFRASYTAARCAG
jgi:hypothetical protein